MAFITRRRRVIRSTGTPGVVAAATGPFSMAFPTTNLYYNPLLAAAQGSFTESGQAVNLTYSSSLLTGSESDGTQLLSGTDNSFTGWAGVNTTFNGSAALTDPASGSTASRLTVDAVNARHILYFAQTVTGGVDYKISAYFKRGSTTSQDRYVVWSMGGSSSGKVFGYFDLQTGAVTDYGQYISGIDTVGSATIAQGANGFWKCTAPFNSPSGQTVYFAVAMTTSATIAGDSFQVNDPLFNGDGTSNLIIWRPKLSTYP